MSANHVINVRIERPDPVLVAQLADAKMEVIAEQVEACQLMDIAIKPLALRDMRFVGPAVTVSIDRADTLMGYGAVGVAQPGDVIVVAAQGDCSRASWGGGLTLSARNIGCAGVVVDGAVIDTPSILRRQVPVFCRTATLAHPVDNRPGSINVPVRCGGVLIHPGDVIVGDLDGVIVIPRDDLARVVAAAMEKTARLVQIAARLEKSGETLLDINGGRSKMTDAGVKWID